MSPRSSTKQVFVAYSYKTYKSSAFRKPFRDLESRYRVRFIFADEKLPKKTRGGLDTQLDKVKRTVLKTLKTRNGFSAAQLASVAGTNVDVVQSVLDPLIRSKRIRYKGNTRGRKYFIR